MRTRSIILFVSFLLVSCSESKGGPELDTTVGEGATSDTESLLYLALGDSYTIGESVTANARYPVQLANALVPGPDNKEVRIIAQTGWTTEELANALATATDLKASYDLVSLLIGVNNQYQGRSLENYRVEFRDLLERAIELAGNATGRVFVVSIPDYAFTPFGGGNPLISEEIDAFNLANRSITAEYGIQYFDITPISRQGLVNTALVATDGLHPSAEQYRLWVELMLDDVRVMLQ